MAEPYLEKIIRNNLDIILQHPIDHLPDAVLQDFIDHGTVESIRRAAHTPQVSATCPLCGRPSTHLLPCTGSDCQNFWLDIGENCCSQMRAILANMPGAGIAREQTAIAARHAFKPGGCWICPTCYCHTLPNGQDICCPLRLLGERLLPNRVPAYLEQFLSIQEADKRSQAVQDAILNLFPYWVDVWNTDSSEAQRKAVAEWRTALLVFAFGNPNLPEIRTE